VERKYIKSQGNGAKGKGDEGMPPMGKVETADFRKRVQI